MGSQRRDSRITIGESIIGSKSILNNPYLAYENYSKTNFPSGKIKRNTYINCSVRYQLKHYLIINNIISCNIVKGELSNFTFRIGVNFFFAN